MLFFGNTTTTTNKQLLTRDFVEYPPVPLSIDNHTEYVIRVKEVSRIKYIASELLSAFHAMYNGENKDLERHLSIEDKQNNNSIRNFVNNSTFTTRLLLYLFSPVLVIIVFIFVLIHKKTNLRLRNTIKTLNRTFNKGYGHVNPVFGQYNILIKKNKSYKANKIKEDIKCVVTHEFAHVMQQHDRLTKNRGYKLKASQICNLVGVINDQNCRDPYMKYLFEIAELEARLHEIIVAGYEKHRLLPLTNEDFFNFILHNESIFLGFSQSNSLLDSLDPEKEYVERCDIISSDIFLIFKEMTDDGIREKFIREVLYFLYSNLLRYYGDVTSSMKVLESCESSGLFQSIYTDY